VSIALALEPDLLILDEATASLDTSMQVMELLLDLQQALELTYLWSTGPPLSCSRRPRWSTPVR